VAPPSILSVNGADTYRAAALQGLGLIQAPRYSVEQDLRDGVLVECLPDTPPSSTSVYVLYPRSRQLSLRVRVVTDWLTKQYCQSRCRPDGKKRLGAGLDSRFARKAEVVGRSRSQARLDRSARQRAIAL
jgi:hypothetical protein